MKKRIAQIIISLAWVAIVSVAAPNAQAATQASAKVSFTFDDGFRSTYTIAAPTLAKYGLIGTSYPVTSCVGTPTRQCPVEKSFGFMNWKQIKALQDQYGWEVGSHTVTHKAMTTLTAAKVSQELINSKNALTSRGITADAYCSPYGDYNNNVIAAVARSYSSHRGFADTGYNSFPYNDYLLYVQQVQAGVTVDQVKGYIDHAKANNLWLILAFHDISPTPSADPNDFQYSSTDLEAIAAYAAAQGVASTTVSRGLVSGDNLLPNGDFTSGFGAGWTTDAPALIKPNTQNKGSYPNATQSIEINSGATNKHLFSPKVAVEAGQAYVIKSFLNVVRIASGEVGFYIDEYDAAGNWISGQYKRGENSVFVENLNFEYVPSSAAVTQARLQVFVTANSNAKAFIDNVQWISQGREVTPTPVPEPTPEPTNLMPGGDFDAGLSGGWRTDNPTSITAVIATLGAQPNQSAVAFTATTANSHVFSPLVAVESATSYQIKQWLSVDAITSGVVGFYIDEYDAAGNWISGQYKASIGQTYSGDYSFDYTPTSAGVARASWQMIVTGNSGASGHIDSVRWFVKP
jgi:hypothetical protein